MAGEKIVVVDDQEFVREGLKETLIRAGYNVRTCERGAEALKVLAECEVGVLITDLRMPEMGGMELLDEVRKLDDSLPVIMVTAFATVENAVAAMKKGAYDYVMKPFNADAIEVVVAKAVAHRRLVNENEFLRNELRWRFSKENFIGSSEPMQKVFEQIAQVAASNATVFVRGESGTGKELVAGAIHLQSPRAAKPFVRVNCAALSAGLLESELFGHEKGAFTGADRRRIGRFELADNGTLLLDEVSEMDLSLQGKILRVLQEKEFERVGSSDTISTNARVIATSNRNLEQAVAEGSFRQDLFYRLNVVPLELPPLRKRMEDIEPLVRHFIGKYNTAGGRRVLDISKDALGMLKTYNWPGNVRELENIIERAIVLGSGEIIELQQIAPGLTTRSEIAPQGSPEQPVIIPLAEVEKEYINKALQFFAGHRQKTASALGISERSLRDRLKRWKENSPV